MVLKHYCTVCMKTQVERDPRDITPVHEYWPCQACFAAMPKPKRRKMGNVPCIFDHRWWPSKIEAQRWAFWLVELARGEVDRVILHPTFYLGLKRCSYVADSLIYSGDRVWAEEVKGRVDKYDSGFSRNRGLWLDHGSCHLHVTTRTGKQWRLFETITGGQE